MKEGKKLEKKRSRYKRALRAVFLLLSYSFFITRWCNIYFFCFCTYNSSSSRWLNGWKWLWLISLLFTVSLYIYLGAWWSFQLHFQNLQQRFWLNRNNLKDLTEYDQSKCVLAGASLVAQMVKNLLPEEPKWDPWVTKTPWRREWQPTPVFLPWRIPWTEATFLGVAKNRGMANTFTFKGFLSLVGPKNVNHEDLRSDILSCC